MKKIIIIFSGVIIFIAILIVVLLLEQLKKPKEPILPAPSATPSIANEKPAIKYDDKGTDVLLKTVTVRPTSRPDDRTARQNLIDKLGGKSGVITSTSTYTLEYSKIPDSFSVEIKSVNIDETKTAAVEYLNSQGLSNDGICKLPLFFYLSYQIAKQIKTNGVTFSPVPDFCK